MNQTAEHWSHDIKSAVAASIDGFALNIGANDFYTLGALRDAYEAADKIGDFSLFLSFDFGAHGGWNIDTISNLTNEFKDEPAQFKVDGKPLVSTFEGVGFTDGWKQVRTKVPGDIYFVPDWSSMGPHGVEKVLDQIEGHCWFSPRSSIPTVC